MQRPKISSPVAQIVGLLLAALLLLFAGYYIAIFAALILAGYAVWRIVSYLRRR